MPIPYGGPYVHPDSLYPPMHGGGAYAETYGGLHGQKGLGAGVEGISPYGGGVGVGVGSAPLPTSGGAPMWGGAYDAPLPRR